MLDAPEDGEMDMAVFELVEHALDGVVVVREGLAHTRGQACIMDKVPETFAGQCEVIAVPILTVAVSRRRFLFPAPFWQRGERPLQYVH